MGIFMKKCISWWKKVKRYDRIRTTIMLLTRKESLHARRYSKLPFWQWGAGNVYLLVLSSWKVNIAENPIAVMGLKIRLGLVSSAQFGSSNVTYICKYLPFNFFPVWQKKTVACLKHLKSGAFFSQHKYESSWLYVFKWPTSLWLITLQALSTALFAHLPSWGHSLQITLVAGLR